MRVWFVIVLLLVEAEGGEHNAVVGRRCQVMYPESEVGGEAKVAGNDRQRRWEIAPIGVIDGVDGVVMVGAPFQFSESGVTAGGDPVCYCADEGVLRGTCGKFLM